MIKLLKDRFGLADSYGQNSHPRTLWAKTEIIGGYGLYTDNRGVSQLNEVVFSEENMVPIGGVQYAMEQIYGVKGPLIVPTLNDMNQIGAQGSRYALSNDVPYPDGYRVCLFGIGTGGAAENNITKLDVRYNDTGIDDMIPFRYTNDQLTDSETLKYYGKKSVNGITGYYLKKFDSDPVIRHLFKNADEDLEDGSEVDSTIFNSLLTIGVETFTETILTIGKKDTREWFTYNGEIEMARMNSIALFSAVYDDSLKDYALIQMFSKLNIPTEPLSLTKDMNIIYRVYGA